MYGYGFFDDDEMTIERQIADLLGETPIIYSAEDLSMLTIVDRSYFDDETFMNQDLFELANSLSIYHSGPETRFDGSGRGLNANYDSLGLGEFQVTELVQWYGHQLLRDAFPVARDWILQNGNGDGLEHRDAESLSMGIYAIVDLVDRIGARATTLLLSDDGLDPVQFLKDPDVGKMNPLGLELYITSAYRETGPSMHLNH